MWRARNHETKDVAAALNIRRDKIFLNVVNFINNLSEIP